MKEAREVGRPDVTTTPVLYPGLTNEQEIYCNEIVRGKSRTEAFDIAYPGNNYSNKSKGVRVSQIHKNEKIIARIEELYTIVRQRMEDTTLYSFEDSTKNLTKLIKMTNEEIDKQKVVKESQARIIISATQELNKMFGYSTPKEKEGSSVNVVFLNSDNIKE